MKLTIHEVAQVVGAKNDVSIFEDTQLEKAGKRIHLGSG